MVLRGIKNSIETPDKKKIVKEVRDLLCRWMVQMTKRKIQPKALDQITKVVTHPQSPLIIKISGMLDDIISENQDRITE